MSAVGNQEKFVSLQNFICTFTEGYLKSAFFFFFFFKLIMLSLLGFSFPGIQVTNKPVPGKGRENRKREGVEKGWWGRSRGK